MTELHWTPAWRLHEMMKSRELSPVELLQATLERLDRLNPIYSMYITVARENGLDAARASEARYRDNEPLSGIDGIPVSMKDNIWTKGIRTTDGSLAFSDVVPDVDSTPSLRLRAAGAVIFGKTNLPEFGMFRRSVNRLGPETRNAWDRSRSSGGSSGGSGVTVSVGVGPVSIGTDGGGSIRIPSAFSGVFGILPSRGRVPEGPCTYIFPGHGLGPMTRNVRDAARFMTILAPPDLDDPYSARTPSPDYEDGLDSGVAGVRMAWSGDFGRVTPTEPGVIDAVHAAARVFADLGAQYSEPDLRIEDTMDLIHPNPRHSYAQVRARYRKYPNYFGIDDLLAKLRADPERWEQLCMYVKDRTLPPTALEYTMGISPDVRDRPIDHFEDLFQHYDILMSPVISRTAFPCHELNITPPKYVEYTQIANCTGYAAASLPAGFVDGMPVGLQLIARPDDEALLLRACRAFEQARPWADIFPTTLDQLA